MEVIKYHENAFLDINIEQINNAEIVILKIKKEKPSNEEWESFSEAFKNFHIIFD